MKPIFKEFMSETTCHGWKYVGDSKSSIFIRMIWLAVVLALLGGLSYTLIKTYLSYQQHRFLTVTRTEGREEIPFPAITVCNRGKYSNASGFITEEIAEYILSSYGNTYDWSRPGSKNIANISIAHFLQETAFDWPSIISQLMIGYSPMDTSVLETIDTDEGKCLIINGPQYVSTNGRLKLKEMGSDKGLTIDLVTFQHFYVATDTLDAGFEVYKASVCGKVDFNQPETIFKIACLCIDMHCGKTKQKVKRHSGPNYDVIRSCKRCSDWQKGGGRMLFLHEPHEKIKVRSGGILLSPGTNNLISLSPVEYKLLPYPYKSHGKEYCLEESDEKFKDINKLYGYKEYSRDSCLRDCAANVTVHHCGCKTLLEKGKIFDDIPRNCTMYEVYNCYYYEYVKNVGKAEKRELCECPWPCRQITYETKLSNTLYPSITGVHYINKLYNANLTVDYARNNLLKVKIFFKDMFYTEIEHVPEFDFDAIFGRIGGQMGLFLGASMVSIFELFVYMIKLIWYGLGGRRANTMKTNVQPLTEKSNSG